MFSIRSLIRASIPLIVVIVLAQPAEVCASKRQVPVFRRTPSGYVLQKGQWRTAPERPAVVRPKFSIEKTSGRIPKGRLLSGGEGAPPLSGEFNIALVRIAFESNDDNGLSSIDTDGDFDLTPGGTQIVDPTPHNRDYFNAHMEGLATYYGFQSCGRLDVTWDVLPFEQDGSYKLSDVADYGPGSSGRWTTELLVQFLHAAITAADDGLASAGYPVRLSDYDAVMIVHAGADMQSDYNADSPNDIPSLFAMLGDGDEIPIEGGSEYITEVSLVPETSTQDGYYGSTASVIGHEFGHCIGLPDLYDTYYSFPVVGVWDHMDSGSQLGAIIVDENENEYYATGIVSSGLGAWTRYVLGWVEVDTVRTFDPSASLPAAERCPSRIYRVDISNTEYFLVENRAVELDGLLTGFVVDEQTGVIIGTGNCLNCSGGIPYEIEWELVNGYDILLPTESDIPETDAGPGILAWHVDEQFIADRYYFNEVNARWPYGVSLVEAGGVVDLGNPYSRFSYGWYDDAFFDGNRSEFGDSTIPSSWSNWQVPSGVRLEDISARDTLMTFGIGNRELLATEFFDPGLAFDIPDGGFLPFPGEFGAVYFNEMGSMREIPDPGEGSIALRRRPVTPIAFAEDFAESDGADAVIVADSEGTIRALRDDGEWTDCSGWPVYIDTLASHPVVMRTVEGAYVAAATTGGALHVLSNEGNDVTGSPQQLAEQLRFTGNIVVTQSADGYATGLHTLSTLGGDSGAWLSLFPFSEGELSADGGWQVHIPLDEEDMSGQVALLGGQIDPLEPGDEVWVVSMETGRMILCGSGGILAERPGTGELTGVPALQDINGDSYVDIIYSSGDDIFVVSPSGSNVTGWPRSINGVFALPAPVRVNSPVTTACNGSGAWVVAVTDMGILFIFDHSGELVPGYPRRVAGSMSQAIEIVDVDGQGSLAYIDLTRPEKENDFYLFFEEQRGTVRWRKGPFGGAVSANSWRSLYGGPERTGFALPSGGFEQTPADWSDVDQNLVIYPNPSRGGRVGFHFTAPGGGEAHLQIMTLTGELVLEESKSLSGGEDEFTVSMAGNAPGVYLCRLVISSEGKRAEAHGKFAIVN